MALKRLTPEETTAHIAKSLRRLADALDRGEWVFRSGELYVDYSFGDPMVRFADGSGIDEGLARLHGDVTFSRLLNIPALGGAADARP